MQKQHKYHSHNQSRQSPAGRGGYGGLKGSGGSAGGGPRNCGADPTAFRPGSSGLYPSVLDAADTSTRSENTNHITSLFFLAWLLQGDILPDSGTGTTGGTKSPKGGGRGGKEHNPTLPLVHKNTEEFIQLKPTEHERTRLSIQ